MRTLIYTLAPQGSGTRRLAKALTDIGLMGGHEVVGQANCGSVRDINHVLRTHLFNPCGYPIGEDDEGDAGDNDLADAFFEWAKVRFQEVDVGTLKIYAPVVARALHRFLIMGDPHKEVFVDSSHWLADWYPVLDYLCDDGKYLYTGPQPGWSSRSIHLSRDPREWVQKWMWHGVGTRGSGGHYGSIHNEWTLYPPWPHECRYSSRFERVCTMWRDLHRWLLRGKRKHFRVEDFNRSETAKAILAELLPEATDDQREAFSLTTEGRSETGTATRKQLYDTWNTGPHKTAPWPEWSDELWETFNGICGDTAGRLGYKYGV